MTPMVDLGFLLVTFFMMMTQFAPLDPVKVAIPHSSADTKLPETNVIKILVSKDGGVFFMMDRMNKLKSLGENLNARWNLGFSEEELVQFSRQTSFGVPASGLRQFLAMSPSEQKNMFLPGIPVESGKNELADWLVYAKAANPQAKIVIKGDRLAPYPVIKKVMDTLQDCEINKFSLITDTEKKEQ